MWALCLFGICGLQRFYAGQIAWGIAYLVTFGFFGIGQLIDLALIPSLVRQRNAQLRRLYWAKHGEDWLPSDLPTPNQPLPALATSAPQVSPMQKLLKAAHEHGGQLSKAQAALHTGLSPEQIETVLQEALRLGYADVTNDPKTGAVRYVFDI